MTYITKHMQIIKKETLLYFYYINFLKIYFLNINEYISRINLNDNYKIVL